MSEYDLLKALSELDEKQIMQPRLFVSTRLNILFCLLSAIFSSPFARSTPVFSLFIYFVSFALLYISATILMNRKSKRKLLNEPRRPVHAIHFK